MNTLGNTVKKPIVDTPHFKNRIRQIRASSYDIFQALSDIIDNAVYISDNIIINLLFGIDDNLKSITITDDSNDGFTNILKNGESNPFNMAHFKVGHEYDNQTSEFGTGMKQAAISCCNDFSVVTRVKHEDGEIKYYEINFDFDSMCLKVNPHESYEYDKFSEINYDSYIQKQKFFEKGSTIILKDLTDVAKFNKNDKYTNNGLINNSKLYIQTIIDKLSLTYGEYIYKNKINISVAINNEIKHKINYHDDYNIFFKNNQCKKRMITHKLYCLISNKIIKEIYIKQIHGNIRYFKYGEKLNFKENKIDENEFKKLTNTDNIYELELKSTSICNIEEFKNYDIINGRNKIFINRFNRNYSIDSLIEVNDGYSNHIYNILRYKNKKLNSYLGVTFNKQIKFSNSNKLVKLLGELLALVRRKSGYLGKYVIKPDPVKPDPVKPDPVKPDPVKPDPVKPDPVKPDPVKPTKNTIIDIEFKNEKGIDIKKKILNELKNIDNEKIYSGDFELFSFTYN